MQYPDFHLIPEKLEAHEVHKALGKPSRPSNEVLLVKSDAPNYCFCTWAQSQHPGEGLCASSPRGLLGLISSHFDGYRTSSSMCSEYRANLRARPAEMQTPRGQSPWQATWPQAMLRLVAPRQEVRLKSSTHGHLAE